MILLLDVDGVLQFGNPGFIEQVEREYVWRHGYFAFRDAIFADPEYWASLEGRGDFLSVARRHLAHHVEGLSAETFFDWWVGENVAPNHPLLEAVPTLGASAIYLATNQDHLRAEWIETHYARYSWLNGAFISSRLGASKPSRAYFEKVLAALGCPAADVVFVDDHLPNVEGARMAGMAAVQYRDNVQLLAELATALS